MLDLSKCVYVGNFLYCTTFLDHCWNYVNVCMFVSFFVLLLQAILYSICDIYTWCYRKFKGANIQATLW